MFLTKSMHNPATPLIYATIRRSSNKDAIRVLQLRDLRLITEIEWEITAFIPKNTQTLKTKSINIPKYKKRCHGRAQEIYSISRAKHMARDKTTGGWGMPTNSFLLPLCNTATIRKDARMRENTLLGSTPPALFQKTPQQRVNKRTENTRKQTEGKDFDHRQLAINKKIRVTDGEEGWMR